MEYTEDMTVFVLANHEYRFVGLGEMTSDRQWVYAFTSKEKAENFLRITRQAGWFEGANRLFPCTLAEWFDMQAKQKLPDLAINPDPEKVRDYPMMIADMAKHNISCVTLSLPSGGKISKIAVSPRSDRQAMADGGEQT